MNSTAANQLRPPASRATWPSWPNGESTNAVGRRRVRMPPLQRGEMLLPQGVERLQRARNLDVPEGPSVAGRRLLQRGAYLVDRARMRFAKDRTIGPNLCAPTALGVDERGTRRDQPAFDQQSKRYARLLALVAHRSHGALVEGKRGIDPRACHLHIFALAFDSDPAPTQTPRDRSSRSRAEERIEHDVARLRASEEYPVKQSLRLLGRMSLRSIRPLHPLRAGADRHHPVGTHLEVVVEGFHCLVIESVTRLFVLRAPEQGFVSICEAGTAEVWHRVRLAPDDIVEDPEIRVLQQRSNPVDVVIASNHPDRAVFLEPPPCLLEPVASEVVVAREAFELVPVIIDGVDAAAFGPEQVPAQLQIIGWVCKDHVHRLVRQSRHLRHAVALQDDVERQDLRSWRIWRQRTMPFRNTRHEVHN